ncbi:2,3-diaminopropionate biosynthesis protein SbnB [Actinoplanes sp. NEAU-A12]|uniref:2,3-diaminopropionate biosynthesis protein SbnB n=1 Tax=Actinoplanes sandaracinus TaxID=3045177 RepID=A0ABT6WHP9_9ACTN|nr:2,3-diaminopropionate biosynthesis protein SbnB [Actinoplanes sandaracinus]MDI6099257.1 2,3-diaminopropionate biosynthesis protein SbnB [Actinoplanes sandaracinus]
MTLTVPDLTVLTAADISGVIEADREACVEAVRLSYLWHDEGDSALPHSSFLRFPHRHRDRAIALPGYLGGGADVAGIKWIASFPGNTAQGIPRASAVLVLNDVGTGYPYALLEASVISASRTAASAVLGAEQLIGGRRAPTVAFIGTGLIADHVRRFLRDLKWDVDAYRLYDLDPAAAATFGTALKDDGAEDITVCTDIADAMAADLVVLATVAGEPHLHDPALLAHRPVVLHLSLRDLGPELVLAAQNVTDDIDHAVRERTSLHLTVQQTGNRDFVDGTLADLLTGRLRRDPERAAIFAPFGLGVLDLAVGAWAFEQVVAAGGGRSIPGFFPSSGVTS